jgi:indole-3-glycerol phosphate synthase
VGINNRDLKTFRVDLAVSRELLPRIPAGVFAVSESGLTGPEDLDELSQLGSSAFLIGEALITAPEPGEALTRFVSRGGP